MASELTSFLTKISVMMILLSALTFQFSSKQIDQMKQMSKDELFSKQIWTQTYIAIFTQPNTLYEDLSDERDFLEKNSYVASSYIKYVEATGSQTLIIPWDMPWGEMVPILENTHGIILPGGNAEIIKQNPYMDKIKKVLNWVKERNDKGFYYFVLGICMGYEQMLISEAEDHDVLESGFNHYDKTPVNIPDIQIIKESKFFNNLSVLDLREALDVLSGPKNILYAHGDGISLEAYKKNPLLTNNTNLIGSSTYNGKEFVAMLENNRYPLFSMQFHPEKNAWEKKRVPYVNLNRSKATVDTQHKFMSNLIELSRKSRNYEFDWANYDIKAKSFFSYNFIAYPGLGDMFESSILFTKLSDQQVEVWQYVTDNDFEDDMFRNYQKLRNRFQMNQKRKNALLLKHQEMCPEIF